MKNYFGLIMLGASLSFVGLIYWAISWIRQHPEKQETNILFARKVLGKGFKIALNGVDWNQNLAKECIAFMPIPVHNTKFPHLRAIRSLVVIENQQVLFSWASRDTIALIPIINSPKQQYLPIFFTTHHDSLNLQEAHRLIFRNHFQIIKP